MKSLVVALSIMLFSSLGFAHTDQRETLLVKDFKPLKALLPESLRDQAVSTTQLAAQTDQTVSVIVRLVVFELRLKGYDEVAEAIEDEAKGFEGYLSRSAAIGDHKPLSDFLARVCFIAEALLGEYTYKALHIDDLFILNFGIPVTFDPNQDSAWCQETKESTCKIDYRLHTVPVLGVVTYWAAWGGCTGATWGAGAITFICAPIGSFAENVMVLYFAGDISNRVWDRHNAPPHTP